MPAQTRYLATALLALALPAAAQPAPRDGLSLTLGGGALAFPAYPGGSRARFLPLPFIEAGYAETVFLSFPEIARVDVPRALGLQADGFSAGPLARFRFGRRERDDSRDLRGLGNVPGTVELGGFAAYRLGGGFSLRGNLTRGAGGHDGVVADVALGYARRVGPVLLAASAGPSIVDGTYNRAFYGVDARQAARSGRPAYRPGGGVERVSLNLVGNLPLNDRWGLTGFGSYGRLLGDAADSPIVTGRGGSPDQFAAGLFLTWRAW